ncbi:MAG: MCE family protein [Deltaproteobacteria bacterium]|nr:MCE family protein [Deltaproteobacteria bacterium]
MRWLSRAVTLAVVAAVVTVAVLFLRARVPDAKVGEGFRTYAIFRDASRLAVGSPVVIAGVRVGDITRLGIEGDVARVDMLLKDDVDIPADAFATRRADSLFGDSYIVIIPNDAAGSGQGRRLKDGEPIAHVEEGGSTDNTLRTIGRALPRIDRGLETVHEVAVDGRTYVQGPVRGRLEAADRWVAEGGLANPLGRANDAMRRLEEGTAKAAQAVHDAVPDLDRRLRNLDEAVASARTRIHDANASIATGLADARAGLDRIDPIVRDMQEVAYAIDEGKAETGPGRIGRLVNDRELADAIEDGTETLRDAAANLNYFKSFLGMRAEASRFSQGMRVYATAELRSRAGDKFFLVEIVRSDLGDVPNDSLSEQPGSPLFTRRQTITDTLRFSLQFGKQFGPLALRGGIKDSTFGLGADLLFRQGRVRLSADLFGSYQPTPRLKLAASIAIIDNMYIVAGVDDALNKPGYLPVVAGNTPVPNFFDEVRYGRDYFLGAALRFNDEDLALLLRIYGATILSLLL